VPFCVLSNYTKNEMSKALLHLENVTKGNYFAFLHLENLRKILETSNFLENTFAFRKFRKPHLEKNSNTFAFRKPH